MFAALQQRRADLYTLRIPLLFAFLLPRYIHLSLFFAFTIVGVTNKRRRWAEALAEAF